MPLESIPPYLSPRIPTPHRVCGCYMNNLFENPEQVKKVPKSKTKKKFQKF